MGIKPSRCIDSGAGKGIPNMKKTVELNDDVERRWDVGGRGPAVEPL